MSNGNVDSPGATRASGLDPTAVAEWLRASAGTRPSHARSRRSTSSRRSRWSRSRRWCWCLAQTGFATGTHELYQLPLCFISPDELGEREAIQRTADWVVVDAVADPELGRELLRAIDDERTIETDEGCARFVRVGSGGPLRHDAAVRPMGVEQSNSSIVFADETVLKVFRHPGAGDQPRARDAALPDRARVRVDRAAAGLLRVREPHADGDARRRAAVHGRRGRRLGAGARSDRHRPGRVPDLARGARRGHGRAAQRARVRQRGSRVRARGAQPGGAGAAGGDARRGDRPGVPAAARRRARGAARRPRPGRPRADLPAAPSSGSAGG